MPVPTPQYPPGERVKKSIRFTPETHNAVVQTSENTGLNFSQTVEMLVKLGLQDTTTITNAELVKMSADQGVSRALNRYLKMVSQIVISANEANEMARQIFFTQLCDLSQRISDPDEIDRALSLDPNDELDSALIELYQQRQERARNRAVRKLKSALNIDDEIWNQITLWGRDDEQKTIE